MTSSLVGSEMCIRDSRLADLNVTSTSQLGRLGKAHKWGIETLLAKCPSSVSYTHLTLPTICSV
eukprot:3518363-Prorocentrum_lima.AAC.1